MCSLDYITVNELKELIDSEKIEGKSEASLKLLIGSGKELIDWYCKKQFEEIVPNTVKVVNMELVRAMLNDNSKESENVEGYSYKNNPKVYEQILKKLDSLVGDSAGWPQKRKIRSMVI